MARKDNLDRARKAKNDEFYTRYEDIAKEMPFYARYFKDKIIYCNCDTMESNFYKYFRDNFHTFGLKKLIITGLGGVKAEYYGKDRDPEAVMLKGDTEPAGSFKSAECEEILKECDIVCTNPPFSLWRQYFDLLQKHKKQFLIIGNMNAITYKNVFPHFKNKSLWVGVNKIQDFLNSDKKMSNVYWFTNMWHGVIKKLPEFTETYTPEKYPKYDNCDAINVDRIKDIPKDYMGKMGVPITILEYFTPNSFILEKFRYGDDGKDLCYSTHTHTHTYTHHTSASLSKLPDNKKQKNIQKGYCIYDSIIPIVNGQNKYKRIILCFDCLTKKITENSESAPIMRKV